MKNTLPQTIAYELRDIVSRHLDEIRLYVPSSEHTGMDAPDAVLMSLKRLNDLQRQSTSRVMSFELYEEVREAIETIQTFLKVMNQQLDTSFVETGIGRILVQAQDWCQMIAQSQSGLALQAVWDLIAPVKPDHLCQVSPGIFEAQWWKPIPWMDVEILRRTDGVTIYDEKANPKHLPGGIAVRFSAVAGYNQSAN